MNLKEITHGKVGDIIYPAYNKTNGWFAKGRWDVVLKVDKKGRIIAREFVWNHATIRAIEIIKKLKEQKGK